MKGETGAGTAVRHFLFNEKPVKSAMGEQDVDCQ